MGRAVQNFSGVWEREGARSRLIEDNAMPQDPAQVLNVHPVGAQRQSTSNIYQKKQSQVYLTQQQQQQQLVTS